MQNMTLLATPRDYDIICIQEPYLDDLGLTRATTGWYVIYPTKHRKEEEGRTRSVILVNKKIATNAWSQIDVDSVDVTAIKITNKNTTISIYNIYNDCTNDKSTDVLERHLEKREREHENNTESDDVPNVNVWLGDFNRHHVMWEDDRNH